MKLAIAGLSGRMGQAIQAVASPQDDTLIGLTREGGFNAALGADAIIDFTRPEYSLQLLDFAAENNIAFVSGTTGFSQAQTEHMQQAAKRIPVFWASNMSIGVALVNKLVRQAAAGLPENYDIEVLEMHHRHKVDAPSGTAITLGKSAAQGRGVVFEDKAVLSREGNTGERKAGDIGFATLRGGNVIGEHSVLFAGSHDVIEIAHRSASRSIYAEGALRAACWLQKQPAGFYSMDDLLS